MDESSVFVEIEDTTGKGMMVCLKKCTHTHTHTAISTISKDKIRGNHIYKNTL